ncbi:MAG TPA: DNA-3-methyladenine glycosylase I [Treponema sp.]|nr:DNA-3-methyladenine glycosylase I [Treponema sp.]
MAGKICRCSWCEDGGLLQDYHDTEWGIPVHDDRKQFEFLMLEVMQCGLNWMMMLKKREIFRSCFNNFEYEKIAQYTEADVERILAYPGMIRSRRKTEAVIHNAQCFIETAAECHSFSKYLWGFTQNRTVLYRGHNAGALPARTELSDLISADLRKRGFKYLGSVTVYAHMQACGIVNDHLKTCFLYRTLTEETGSLIVRMKDNG